MPTNISPSESEGAKWMKLQLWVRQACENAGITAGGDDPLLSDISPSDSEGVKWAKLQRWVALLAENISGGGGGGGGYEHPATHAQSVIDSSSGWITTALAGKQAAGSYLTTTGTAADSAKLGGVAASGYSQTSHTHNYAGSSSPGGAATSAEACTGNAATATKWATARSVTLSGVVTGSASIDGSADATMNTSIADGALPIAKTSGLQTALDDKVSVSATGLGIVGNGSVGTLSTPADWAAIPVGCSRIYNGTTATGFPGDWPWYVTKIANRDMGGGYCVLAVDFLYASTYMGCAGTSADYPTWKQYSANGHTHAQSEIDSSSGWITTELAGITTEATTRATNDNALWAALYAEQCGGTECIIPLAATGDGSGVLTLRLWSDVANTAKISAGAFYGEIGGTTSLGQSVAMTAGQYTTFYIKLPASATATLTITYGWALTKWGQSGTECIVEATNAPKLNGFNIKYIPQNVTTIRLNSNLGTSIVTGSTRAWTSATGIYLFGNSMTIGGITYPWAAATTIYINGGSMTIGGATYPWAAATTIWISGGSMTLSGTTYPWTSATIIYFSGNSMTIGGATYPWTASPAIVFAGYSMTISANLSTSCLATGNLYLLLEGTGIAVTYPTTRIWPTTMRGIYLRPKSGSMVTADVDRLFIDVNTYCTTAISEKDIDARGNCGAVTSASSAARASLVAKGFAVSFNS